jgi:protein-tyrosine phosphatase
LKTRPTFKSILVLCEGNHCRSPIAEGLFRQALPLEISVQSAGLKALEGFTAHPTVICLMAELGLDMSSHRGRQLTPAIALSADLILVMDEPQKDLCARMVPGACGRIFLLGHWLSSPPLEISDPFQQGPDAFRRTIEAIQLSVASWLPHMTLKQRSA